MVAFVLFPILLITTTYIHIFIATWKSFYELLILYAFYFVVDTLKAIIHLERDFTTLH